MQSLVVDGSGLGHQMESVSEMDVVEPYSKYVEHILKSSLMQIEHCLIAAHLLTWVELELLDKFT